MRSRAQWSLPHVYGALMEEFPARAEKKQARARLRDMLQGKERVSAHLEKVRQVVVLAGKNADDDEVLEDIINCLSNANVPALKAWHSMRAHMRKLHSRGELDDYEDLLLEANRYEGELEDDLPGSGCEKIYSACPGYIAEEGRGAYSVGFEQGGGTPQGSSAQQAGATAGGAAAEPRTHGQCRPDPR